MKGEGEMGPLAMSEWGDRTPAEEAGAPRANLSKGVK